MKKLDNFSHVEAPDNQYVDALYETYLENPQELDESWLNFFRGFE